MKLKLVLLYQAVLEGLNFSQTNRSFNFAFARILLIVLFLSERLYSLRRITDINYLASQQVFYILVQTCFAKRAISTTLLLDRTLFRYIKQ